MSPSDQTPSSPSPSEAVSEKEQPVVETELSTGEDEVDEEKNSGDKVREWIRAFVIALAIIIAVRFLLASPFIIKGTSMSPTLKNHQIIVVEKASTYGDFIDRGDIIVFHHPYQKNRKMIKRVIAVGGEEVFIRRGTVYVDGKKLDEPYLGDLVWFSEYGPKKVPPGQFFVLGDNRNNSTDSRNHWFVTSDRIVGVACLRFWPLNQASTL